MCASVRFAVDTELVKRKEEKKIDEQLDIFLEKKREKIGRSREREREKKNPSRQKE
jgi:hypothetical protein